jgi:GTP-binding protein EngB required for normal cell division
MADFVQLKEEVIQVINESGSFAGKVGNETVIGKLNKIKEKLKKNELTVVICGEIKRGKSSLLSALLEEVDLFPINVNVATNAVTIVRHGEKESIEVCYQEDGIHKKKNITRAEIPEYVTEQGNEENRKDVEYLYVQTPNPKLANGLIFVDTPGVGSLNLAHSEITYGYLPNADVILFVSDAQAPLTVSELKFLKKAAGLCNNIIFPMTKVDKFDYKPIYESNLEKIMEYTSLPKEEINIIPVSSLAKLRYLESKNPMMLKSSNYKQLEAVIWTTLSNKRAQILLAPPLTAAAQEMFVIKENLKLQYESLTHDTQATKEMELKLKKLMEEKQLFLEEGAEWRSQLQFEFSKVYDSVIRDIRKKQSALKDSINDIFKDPASIEKQKEISSSVNEELCILALDSKEAILSGINQISNDTEEKLGLLLSINTDITEDINFDKNNEIKLDYEKQGMVEKSITIGRNMMMKSSGGSAISAVIGGLAGAAVGFFVGPLGVVMGAQYGATIGGSLGGILGGGKGLHDGLKSAKKSDLSAISKIYTDYITKGINDISELVADVKKELTQGLINEYSIKLKEQKNQINENIKDIQENMSISKEQAAEKARTIQGRFKELNDIEVKISRLMNIFQNIAAAAAEVVKKLDRQSIGSMEELSQRKAATASESGKQSGDYYSFLRE